MRADKLTIGKSYRHKDNKSYGWAKVIKILKPKECENTQGYIIVKCEWSVDKDSSFGMIKYFRPSNLVEV
jgi:hypothetical protein